MFKYLPALLNEVKEYAKQNFKDYNYSISHNSELDYKKGTKEHIHVLLTILPGKGGRKNINEKYNLIQGNLPEDITNELKKMFPGQEEKVKSCLDKLKGVDPDDENYVSNMLTILGEIYNTKSFQSTKKTIETKTVSDKDDWREYHWNNDDSGNNDWRNYDWENDETQDTVIEKSQTLTNELKDTPLYGYLIGMESPELFGDGIYFDNVELKNTDLNQDELIDNFRYIVVCERSELQNEEYKKKYQELGAPWLLSLNFFKIPTHKKKSI
jgi:hypothetical protein